MKLKNRTIESYLLVILMAFVATGALIGGFNLIADPSGEKISLPAGLLKNTIFPDYLIPGIFLFTFLGIFPLILSYALLFKPRWRFPDHLNIYPDYHWAWTYTLYTAIILIIWINMQMILLNIGSTIQGAFGLLGILILIITLMPRVKRQFREQVVRKRHGIIHK
jgi:hypothetical protein